MSALVQVMMLMRPQAIAWIDANIYDFRHDLNL